MNERLARFILCYSLTERRIADVNFCNQIIKIISEAEASTAYISKVNYQKEFRMTADRITPASYDSKQKILNISLDGMRESYCKLFQKNIMTPLDVLQYNIFVACRILSHETSHVRQKKSLIELDEDASIISWADKLMGLSPAESIIDLRINQILNNYYSSGTSHDLYPHEINAIFTESNCLLGVLNALKKMYPGTRQIEAGLILTRNTIESKNPIDELITNLTEVLMNDEMIFSLSGRRILDITEWLSIPPFDDISDSTKQSYGLK